MFTKIICVFILHAVFGIVIPGVLLIAKKIHRFRAVSWICFSWTFFFSATAIFILTDLVSGLDLGSITAIIFGVVPFLLLAFISILFAIIYLRKSLPPET
jgi:hypothetical protein